MKSSYNGKPLKTEDTKSYTSVGIDSYGNVYAYKTDKPQNISKKELNKTLRKTRFF